MAIISSPTSASPRPPGVPPGPSNLARPEKLPPVSVMRPVYRLHRSVGRRARSTASDSDADLEGPGVDEDAGELLALRKAVDRAQVADGEAEVADARHVDLQPSVGAELPERGRDRAIELEAAHVPDA